MRREGLSGDQLNTDWMQQAVCRDEDPELFFPIGQSGPALKQIAEAKAVCNACPVASACLEYALAKPEDAGVWGGLSEDERRSLKRRRTRNRALVAKTALLADAPIADVPIAN